MKNPNSFSQSIKKQSQNTPYLYDGNLLLAETDSADKIQKVYINDGQGIIGMVRYIYKGDGTFSHYQSLYYLFDTLKSISLVTGEDGKPLQGYKYTPFGGISNTESDPVNELRFIGRYGGYQDDDTNLTYFCHRWYDSNNGRWVSRDPIGIKGGLNIYTYVYNNAILLIDIFGLGSYEKNMQQCADNCAKNFNPGGSECSGCREKLRKCKSPMDEFNAFKDPACLPGCKFGAMIDGHLAICQCLRMCLHLFPSEVMPSEYTDYLNLD